MSDDSDAIRLMVAWDNLEVAAQKVETSLPWQMSDAIRELEAARLRMREVLQEFIRRNVSRAA